MADGYITIQTKIDNNKFDKQLSDLDKKIRRAETEKTIKYELKIEAEKSLKKNKQQIQEMKKEYDELSQHAGRYVDLLLISPEKRTTSQSKEFEDLKGMMETRANLSEMIQKEQALQDGLAKKVQQTNQAYSKTADKVESLNQKIQNIKLQKQQGQIASINKGVSTVGKSTNNAIKSIGRLALGVLSVASAYSIVSKASSTLGQYDEQYATNLEYINYLLAQALAPALKYLVNLASTLLSYLNYILNAWFGITLFSKNSAKNFAAAKASTGGISNNTGKIKKDLQTTSFDEMNVLTDTSDSSSGGGAGGGGILPSIDPSVLAGEIPDWLQWIVDNKDVILPVLAGITAAILAWKLGLEGIQALGIGVAIAGIVETIQALKDYMEDPSFENFGKVIQGIGIAIIGLGIAFLGLPAIIIGVIVLLWGTFVKHWEDIKAKFQSGIDWLKEKGKEIREKFGDTAGDIYDRIVDSLQKILDFFDRTMNRIKANFSLLISFLKHVFSGDWEAAWEDVKQIFSNIWDGIKDAAKTAWEVIKNGAKNMVQAIGATLGNIFKGVVNAVLTIVENVVNNPINDINSLLDVINAVPGINLGYLPQIKIPRLAAGGLINAPGSGVPVGGGAAIGGEAGIEGVIPLTDSSAMETLGEAIGRYITINANITNTMNGRVISRQLKKIQNEMDFAYNT